VLQAVKTLYWVDEPGDSQVATEQADTIQAKLAWATHCCAVGSASCEEIVERMKFDGKFAQVFGAVDAQPGRLRFICSHHSEVLTRCLARVLEEPT